LNDRRRQGDPKVDGLYGFPENGLGMHAFEDAQITGKPATAWNNWASKVLKIQLTEENKVQVDMQRAKLVPKNQRLD